jgi:hypothetical protein
MLPTTTLSYVKFEGPLVNVISTTVRFRLKIARALRFRSKHWERRNSPVDKDPSHGVLNPHPEVATHGIWMEVDC